MFWFVNQNPCCPNFWCVELKVLIRIEGMVYFMCLILHANLTPEYSRVLAGDIHRRHWQTTFGERPKLSKTSSKHQFSLCSPFWWNICPTQSKHLIGHQSGAYICKSEWVINFWLKGKSDPWQAQHYLLWFYVPVKQKITTLLLSPSPEVGRGKVIAQLIAIQLTDDLQSQRIFISAREPFENFSF